LKPEQHGAVLFLLLTVQVKLGQGSGEPVDEGLEFNECGNIRVLAQSGVN